MKTLLDDAGRIRVPDYVQADLGVKVGDELRWEEVDGRWFLEPSGPRSDGSNRCQDSPDVCGAESPSECLPTSRSAADTDLDDLDWDDLDYAPLALQSAGQIRFRIHRRGKLLPLPHDLDQE